MKSKKSTERVSVRLIRSPIGVKPVHKATLLGLGLKRMHQVVELEDTPAVRGMIRSVSYMVEEI